MSLPPFRNEPHTDFTNPDNREKMETALETVRGRLGEHRDMLVAGEWVRTDDVLKSYDPGKPDRLIGTVSHADPEWVDKAVRFAHDYYESTWRDFDAKERAHIFVKAARIMRNRKFELSALECYEQNKNWVEADADVAEAIDFLEYYARMMMHLRGPQPLVPFADEDNSLYYEGKGAVAVIPPWNFPAAIPTGMSSGPLVAGNTVNLSPAPDAVMVGAEVLDIYLEAGLPKEAINFLPGDFQVGDALVKHPLTRMISFTGSREIGKRIDDLAGKHREGQFFLKDTVLEMGGKDGLIVDETADLDMAVQFAVKSAYGFQGQKCSAMSRLIIVDDVYDELVEKFVAASEELEIGHAADNADVCAVINEAAVEKIMAYIDKGKDEGATLLTGGGRVDKDGGFYIQPTVFSDVKPGDAIAQEEIFGPVVACIRAKDFDDAIAIHNGVDYALTGGLISKDRHRLARARKELRVGNLYLNRGITGSVVGVQPFGGFKMSGTDAKAGGPDYLKLFMNPRTVTERL